LLRKTDKVADDEIRAYHDPQVFGGKPCVRGLRFPVSRLLGLLAAGQTQEEILEAYPHLEAGDIRAAIQFAAFLADEQVVEFAS
jgi:uncharacterized protein (DUF433 family)